MNVHTAIFEKSSLMKTDIARMTAFHQDVTVFRKLTPPPVFVQIHEDNRASLTEGDLTFTLWVGLIPIRWHAQHQPGPTEHSFADVMLSGPMQYWRHEHIFEAVAGGVRLTDRVTYTHKPGWRGLTSRLLFGSVPLRLLFFYRHLRTRMAVEA